MGAMGMVEQTTKTHCAGRIWRGGDLEGILKRHAAWIAEDDDGKRAVLREADLRCVDMACRDMRSAVLDHADLSNARLRWTNLSFAHLFGANLSLSDLTGSDLRGADLTDAWLNGAILRNVVGNGREIQSMEIAGYRAAWTDEVLWVGCMARPIKEWESLTLAQIPDDATQAWCDHGAWLLETVRRFPAVPSGGRRHGL